MPHLLPFPRYGCRAPVVAYEDHQRRLGVAAPLTGDSGRCDKHVSRHTAAAPIDDGGSAPTEQQADPTAVPTRALE